MWLNWLQRKEIYCMPETDKPTSIPAVIVTNLQPFSVLELGNQEAWLRELKKWRRMTEESEKVPGFVGPSRPRF